MVLFFCFFIVFHDKFMKKSGRIQNNRTFHAFPNEIIHSLSKIAGTDVVRFNIFIPAGCCIFTL